MKKLVWVGHREAEIFKTRSFFTYSITTWGSNKDNNFSYCGEFRTRVIDHSELRCFYTEKIKKLLNEDDYHFMFYSQPLAHKLLLTFPELKDKFICLNAESTLALLNNKINTRLWLSHHIPVLDFVLLSGTDCTLDTIKTYFPSYHSFVLQEACSAGGLGTYVLNQDNEGRLIQSIKKNDLYLVSYFATPSFSINTHVLISDDNAIFLPSSIQIIENYNDNLIYSGGDFVNYSHIEIRYQEKVRSYAQKASELLRGIGFRGVCGIDFLVYKEEVYFIELNPRFQASTLLLNLALHEANLPSIHQLNWEAFHCKKLKLHSHLEDLAVPYSFYKYKKEVTDTDEQHIQKLRILESSNDIEYILYDGFEQTYNEDGSYLFQAIWKQHISSCSKDGRLQVHPNVPLDYFMKCVLPLTYTTESLIRLKIALLNQGVRISGNATSQLNLTGGYNESVFSSIDLVLYETLRINAPINVNLSSLSPFSLDYIEDKYVLYYYDTKISEVQLEFAKSIRDLKTKNGYAYKSIAFISGDRLRIKPEQGCYFKAHGIGCQFCPENMGKYSSNGYSMEDIQEVIDYCIENEDFRHILIGGGSADPITDENKIIAVADYIHSQTNMPIYLMSLPPNELEYIDKYVNAGISEIAFNIEIYDREIALDYMPGKGKITLEKYILSLKRACDLINHNGNVRTMLMAGMEPIENTLMAIEILAKAGIQPMISVFRPVASCKLAHLIQLTNDELYTLYTEAEQICQLYNLSLGPTCSSCQNNTLALTLEK